MKVISCYDGIADGMITSVTMRCEDEGKVFQEASFNIIKDRKKH